MDITVNEVAPGQAVLVASGRLDLVSAHELRAAVEQVVAAGRTRVVVDLSGVPFVDSSGLGMLVGGLKHARQAGGELRIAGAGAQVKTVLELTKLSRVLRPYDSADEALQDL